MEVVPATNHIAAPSLQASHAVEESPSEEFLCASTRSGIDSSDSVVRIKWQEPEIPSPRTQASTNCSQ